MERKKINASDIENLIEQGFSEEQICQKLELTVAFYKEARKIFGITKKHRKSIIQEFDLIDDRALANSVQPENVVVLSNSTFSTENPVNTEATLPAPSVNPVGALSLPSVPVDSAVGTF